MGRHLEGGVPHSLCILGDGSGKGDGDGNGKGSTLGMNRPVAARGRAWPRGEM